MPVVIIWTERQQRHTNVECKTKSINGSKSHSVGSDEVCLHGRRRLSKCGGAVLSFELRAS